ncbi:MAG: pilus assembly protein [Alphaproteobacteria bacterium]|nr:pilus assembly protein [Alphaproteobacteria bacterium]MDE2629937.1 pilus assembly protein [Alphaproteobacteria bacterium]
MNVRLPGQFCGDCRGAAAVEFALVSIAFVTFVIGISYAAIMVFNTMSLDWAVERAARIAAINKTVTQSDMSSAINDYLSSLGLSSATVTYSVGTSSGVQTAHIVASYDQTYTLPFVSTFNITFSSSAYVPQGS